MKLHSIASLLLEFQGSATIVPWSEDADDYDPWIAADQADAVANASGIRIARNKNLSLLAIHDGDVIGAVWDSLEEDADREGVWVYDFDVAVDPDFRSARVGLQLINEALELYRMHKSDHPTYVKVWVVNPKLVRVLEYRYGFEPISVHGDGSAHMTYYE